MFRLDNGWKLPLKGYKFTVDSDEWSVTLLFKQESNEFILRIEAPFQVEIDGKKLDISLGGELENLPYAGLFAESTVQDAVALDDGGLELNLSDNRSIRVDGSNELEPWSIVGPNGLRIVSTANRELAIWEIDKRA